MMIAATARTRGPTLGLKWLTRLFAGKEMGDGPSEPSRAESGRSEDSSTEPAPRPSNRVEESTPGGGTGDHPDMGKHETDSDSGEDPASTGQAASESNDPTGLEPQDTTDRETDADVDPTSGAPHGGKPDDAKDENTTNAVLLERLDGIEALLERRIDRVLKAFDDKVQDDAAEEKNILLQELAAKEKNFDRLHQELKEYRSDIVQRTSLPLVHGMITLHGDVGKQVSGWREEREDLPLDKWLEEFEKLREDIELLLEDHGVTAYGGDIGKRFDGKRQTVVAKVTTHNKLEDGTVKESRRPGFEQNGQILVKERVAVFEFEFPAPTMSGEPASPEAAGQTDNEED